MTRNVDSGTEQISTKNTDHRKTTTTSRITDNGKTQQGTKNADYGKTTTTSRIMDNGKKQQVTRNADIGRETTTRKIADIMVRAGEAAEVSAVADGEATAVAVVRAGEAAEVSAVAVEADAAAVAAAAEMEPLGNTLDDVVLPEDSQTGRAIGLGVGEGTSGDLMPKMAHESTLVGGGSPRGVGEDSAKDMSLEGEIEGTPEEEGDQIRKSWLEEMDIEMVSETDEPMDRRTELAKKRKAKKERIVAVWEKFTFTFNDNT
ncbi:unnamed protein product [Merluccius merluccius]